MMEVSKAQGTNRPVKTLNAEVVRESSVSIDQWLRKQETNKNPLSMRAPPPMAALIPPVKPKINTVSAAAYSRPMIPATPPTAPGQGAAAAAAAGLASYDDVSSIFERTVGSTGVSKATKGSPWPPTVDDDEEEDPILLMKKAQKEREIDLLQSGAGNTPVATEATMSGVDPTPQFQPPPIRTVPLPQDYIIPQEPIVKYSETEYNIFLTSSDRDWFRNRTENRYNFSVSFNPGNRTGYGFSPAVQERFRNIERIEFVKALLPTESLTTLVRNGGTQASPSYNADRIVNVFSMPFVGVRIAELNNNSFSTNPREDNTFAIVQYDATWNSATSTSTSNPSKYSVGYTAYIPKFLKCQRVYEPTPLAGLQKMTFRIERHDGSLLSNDSDVQAIQRICLSSNTIGIAAANNSIYAPASGGNEYIFIQTAAYFPYSAFTEGDLINMQGYTVAAGAGAAGVDFENYINQPGSLYIVGVANVSSGTIVDGPNVVGYCNILIVRSRYDDPTTGSIARTNSYFGGSIAAEGILEGIINTQPSTASTAAIINLSRQTHLVLRVITRDMDSASNIRPDNV
jgi:hypothetical protein